ERRTMARKINRLNARAAATITKRGRHADGGNLYLSISPNGGRRWVFLYRWHGKPTEIGFGSARDVTLARARELASQSRTKLAEGINPKGARRSSGGTTFGECADRVIEAMRPSWRNATHATQWQMTDLAPEQFDKVYVACAQALVPPSQPVRDVTEKEAAPTDAPSTVPEQQP